MHSCGHVDFGFPAHVSPQAALQRPCCPFPWLCGAQGGDPWLTEQLPLLQAARGDLLLLSFGLDRGPSPVPQQGRVVKLNQEQAAFPEGIPAAGTLLGPLGSCQVLEFYLLFCQGWH